MKKRAAEPVLAGAASGLGPRPRSAAEPARDGIPKHRLDWGRPGLSPGAKRVVRAAIEAILADEDEHGALIPGDADACARSVDWLDDSLGRSSADLRRGFGALILVLEWLPLLVVGAPSRMSRLPLPRRIAYLEGLEQSRIGWLSMLLVAFKVPLSISAFEEGEALGSTGFDRPSTVSRRVGLPVAGAGVRS
jgi:hypothetical protein